MATDNFAGQIHDPTMPGLRAVAVTKSDTTLIDPVPRALWVGGAGNLVIDTLGGDTDVTLAGVVAGTLIPIRATRVKAATTATSVVAIS